MSRRRRRTPVDDATLNELIGAGISQAELDMNLAATLGTTVNNNDLNNNPNDLNNNPNDLNNNDLNNNNNNLNNPNDLNNPNNVRGTNRRPNDQTANSTGSSRDDENKGQLQPLLSRINSQAVGNGLAWTGLFIALLTCAFVFGTSTSLGPAIGMYTPIATLAINSSSLPLLYCSTRLACLRYRCVG
jgi:hypothetical protein